MTSLYMFWRLTDAQREKIKPNNKNSCKPFLQLMCITDQIRQNACITFYSFFSFTNFLSSNLDFFSSLSTAMSHCLSGVRGRSDSRAVEGRRYGARPSTEGGGVFILLLYRNDCTGPNNMDLWRCESDYIHLSTLGDTFICVRV